MFHRGSATPSALVHFNQVQIRDTQRGQPQHFIRDVNHRGKGSIWGAMEKLSAQQVWPLLQFFFKYKSEFCVNDQI